MAALLGCIPQHSVEAKQSGCMGYIMHRRTSPLSLRHTHRIALLASPNGCHDTQSRCSFTLAWASRTLERLTGREEPA
jgi:hypothetical protein